MTTNTSLTVFEAGVPAHLARLFDKSVSKALSEGVGASFPSLSFRGGDFRIRHSGAEVPILNERGRPSDEAEVVIIDSNPTKGRAYFGQTYDPNSPETNPICYSEGGGVPDDGARQKQCDTCLMCPHNQWGSQIIDGRASRGKACKEYRRVAVTMANDLENSAYGGPMLLRVPVTSLPALKQYGDFLAQNGVPYFGMVTRVMAEMEESFPKLNFQPERYLSEEELTWVMGQRGTTHINEILGLGDGDADATAAPAQIAQPARPAAPAPVARPAAAPAPAPRPVAAAAPRPAAPARAPAPAVAAAPPRAAAPAAPAAAPAPRPGAAPVARPAGVQAQQAQRPVTPTPVAAAPRPAVAASAARPAPRPAPARAVAPPPPAPEPEPEPEPEAPEQTLDLQPGQWVDEATGIVYEGEYVEGEVAPEEGDNSVEAMAAEYGLPADIIAAAGAIGAKITS